MVASESQFPVAVAQLGSLGVISHTKVKERNNNMNILTRLFGRRPAKPYSPSVMTGLDALADNLRAKQAQWDREDDEYFKRQRAQSKPVAMSREMLLQELDRYWQASGDGGRAIERKLAGLGTDCLKLLKDIARDDSAQLNVRKSAIACAVTFEDPDKASFLAEFVNGKNPAALYAAYENGDSRAGEQFGLFREAKDHLEKMGHTFTVTNS
jgi:hypothetical protein